MTTITGSYADINTVYNSPRIIGLGDEDITLSNSASILDLNSLDNKTTGIIIADVTDTKIELLKTLTDNNSNNAYNITTSDLDLAEVSIRLSKISGLNIVDNITSVPIDASSIRYINGPISDINTAFKSNGITGLENANIMLSDSTIKANDLNTLNSATNGVVNTAFVQTITGSITDINTAYVSTGIEDLLTTYGLYGLEPGNKDIILSDTTVSASTINFLDSQPTGEIDASTVRIITGTAADINAAYASVGIKGLDNSAMNLLDDTEITTEDTLTSDKTPTISGTAEANSTINLISNGASIGTATTDGSGNFSVTPSSELSDGTYSLTVTATDAATNVSVSSVR